MDRRSFVRAGIAATVAAHVGLDAQTSEPLSKSKKKKNILYLFSDQHRECSMPGKPFSPVLAPNLDRFRKQNFTIENCISNFPLCTPYRGILLSGRWPQQTGVVGNGHKLPSYPDALGHIFNQAGYHTGYVGKWHVDGDENHFIPPERRMGFEDWHAWAATNNHYHAWTYDQDTGARIQPEGWNATLMTDDAVRFLEKQKEAQKPWLLVLSWNPPHPPFNPPAEDEAPYVHPGLETRPNINLAARGTEPHWPQLGSIENLRHAEQGYYGGITGIDKEFARVLATLDEIGQADDTIVIYTSDHGEMMGSHGRMSKIVPFEESCHVPFFVRVPGMTRAGGSSEVLFSAIDIFPTLCGLAGIPVPSHCAGRDLSGVITGEKTAVSVDNVILLADTGAASTHLNELPGYRGIRTDRHTYAVMGDGRWILYDNIADPYQKLNLAADPAHKQLMEELDQKLIAWQTAVGDTFNIKDAVKHVSAFPS